MRIALDTAQLNALKHFLEHFEDAEQLTQREWVVDLYERQTPLSIDLTFEKDCIDVDGAAVMLYDEEEDGWYIGERVEDPDAVLKALAEAGAFGA